MNRRDRRAAAAQERRQIPEDTKRFIAECLACKASGKHQVQDKQACVIHTMKRHGEKDLGICRGCDCAKGMCDGCGRTGEHWLGCPIVGLPDFPNKVLQ